MSGTNSKKFPVTLWLDQETFNSIENSQIKDNLKSRGEVVIYKIGVADIFLKNLEAVKSNPEALDKAMLEIDQLRKQEQFGLYFESLSHEQRMAIIDMVRMIDNGQWLQTRLV